MSLLKLVSSLVLSTLIIVALIAMPCRALDLGQAVVIFPPDLSRVENKAVTMLLEEIEKRTHIHLERATVWPAKANAIIAIGPATAPAWFGEANSSEFSRDREFQKAEGFRIRVKHNSDPPQVLVIGNDERGLMFGVGCLLRHLRMKPNAISLSDDFNLATAPQYRLRGHQLGYRPKTNSYDGWDVATWEQYIRDLVVFGCNSIELIPPRSDDASTSPHFPLPPMEMMIEQSRLASEYGLDVWIWYPAMDQDYSDPHTVDFAINEWADVFKKLPRVDAVFVPGGDPGHTHPKHLMALLEKQSESIHRFHPKAQLWVSPQSFNQEWLDEFLDIMRRDQPTWLCGVVYGPQVRISLSQLRTLIPERYPIRNYPDITHSWRCEYPVPDWDSAYSATEGREPINPRPFDEATIFRQSQPYTIGFLTYSEGCNDDVNKAIWSALGWSADADVMNVLRDYGSYFFGEEYADDIAQGIALLEKNWRAALLTNENVEQTLAHFQALEKSAPQLLPNWRFQQLLYRAYYDAYTRRRLIYETRLEQQAMNRLRDAPTAGSSAVMSEASVILERVDDDPDAAQLRARVFELADALFKSIKMQLSVPLYKAISVERGANLDNIDIPLNNRVWLKREFAEIRQLADEPARLKRIDAIVHWGDPGPGGYYDDLGSIGLQPHLLRGPGFEKDPRSKESSMIDFGYKGGRISWWNNAGTLYETPLTLRYENLDRNTQYMLRVTYASDSPAKKVRLVANDKFEIHPLMDKQFQGRPIEFEIPIEATHNGELTLRWYREPGLGDNGRGCQVAEVWLIKKSNSALPN